jgi:hypothetical protein
MFNLNLLSLSYSSCVRRFRNWKEEICLFFRKMDKRTKKQRDNEAKLQMQLLKARENAAIMHRIPLPNTSSIQCQNYQIREDQQPLLNVQHDRIQREQHDTVQGQIHAVPFLDDTSKRKQMYVSRRQIEEQKQRQDIQTRIDRIEMQRNLANEKAHRLHFIKQDNFQRRSPIDGTDKHGQELFPNYEHDPSEALKLFWESSAILRFEHKIDSDELLNEIRESKISDITKQSCLENFKRDMDPESLMLTSCGVCYTSTFDRKQVISVDKFSNLLRLSPDKFFKITESPYKDAYSLWKDYNMNLGYFIHPSVVNNNSFPICDYCFDSLSQGALPKYCLANGYDLGSWQRLHLPPLTDAEKISISLFRPYGKIIKLLPVSGLGVESEQTGLRGHIIYLPVDGPQVLCQQLPRRDLFSSIEVMFIGSFKEYENLRNHQSFAKWRHDTFSIRGNIVMQWLQVLKQINSLYVNIHLQEYSTEELNDFERISEELLSSSIVATDDVTTKIENSTTSNIASFGSAGDSGLHSVLLTQDILPSSTDGNSLKAVKKMLIDTGPPVLIHQGAELANDLNENDKIILGTYPWLFLFGEGVPARGTEPQRWLEFILNYGDNRFSSEQTLILSLFNQRQRHEASATIASKIKAHPKKIDEFISCVNEQDFMNRLEAAIKSPTSNETKSLLRILLPSLNIAGASVPFGPIERNMSLSQLYALCQHFGLPTWFLTISPSDIDSSLVMKLSGVCNQDLELVLVKPSERARISAMNPVAGAKYFRRLVDKVFIHLFQTTANGESNIRKSISYHSKKVGILGKLIAHFIVFEVQGRGSLHLHSLIWATLSPSLLQRVAHVPDLVKEVQIVLNSMVLADVSIEGYKASHERKITNTVYRGQLHLCPQYSDTQLFRERLEAVITTVNIHNHRPTCAHGKSGKKSCRFCYPQAIVQDGPRPVQLSLNESKQVVANEVIDQPISHSSGEEYYPIDSRDERTIMWQLRRCRLISEEQDDVNFPFKDYEYSNKNVVPYNEIISASLGCNTCLEPLGSTEQAKSAVYYQVKYITKKSTELTNTLSVFYESKKKIDRYPSRAEDAGTPQRTAAYLLNKTINTISTQNEISAMMASASLLGMPPKMCSDIFWFCYIWPAIRYLKGLMSTESNYLQSIDDDGQDLEINESLEDFDRQDIFDMNLLSRSKGEGTCQVFKVDDKYIAVQQHTHYQYRGSAFKDYNFLEYCGIVIIKPKSTKISAKRKREDHINSDVHKQDDLLENTEMTHFGRIGNSTFDFQKGHPLFTSHHQCIRSKLCVPHLAGYPPPTLPAKITHHNKNWNDRANKYAEYYIALMVPWCIDHHVPLIEYNYEGLCKWIQNNTLQGTFIQRSRNMSINIKSTCLRIDQSKKKLMSVYRNEETTHWNTNGSLRPTLDVTDYEDGLDYSGEDGIKEQPDIEIIIQVLRDKSNADEFGIPSNEAEKYITDQMNIMKSLFPLNHQQSTLHDVTLNNIYRPPLLFLSIKYLKDISSAITRDDYDNTTLSTAPSTNDLFNPLQEFIQPSFDTFTDSNLNLEQNRCLQRVMEYLQAKEDHRKYPNQYQCPSPLRMIIHGGPGTGKTRLAESIVSRIQQHGSHVACAAPTGVAASLLPGGRTLHNLFSFPVSRTPGVSTDSNLDPLSSTKIHLVSDRFDNACLLIIDEMSMINTILLSHVSTRLQQILENHEEFGGLPIILMGDMFQLPPTAGESMYKTVFKNRIDSWQRPSQQGATLFSSFSYHELTQNIRSENDVIHSSIISEMRSTTDFKSFSSKLLDHLKVITEDDIVHDKKWLTAPIIVTSNSERHSINFYKAKEFAISQGVPVLTWRKPLCGNLATRFTDEALDMLYRSRVELRGIFVQSAPCVLREENINPSRGLANGTAAYLHSICLENPNDYEDLIRNAQPGELVEIPVPLSVNIEIKYKKEEEAHHIERWPNHLTLQPATDTQSKAVVIPVLSNSDHNGVKFKNTTLHYKDHFVDLAFALTYHKVQGKTMDRIILDINHRPGSGSGMCSLDYFGLYVGISRVRESRHMRILPSHSEDGFQHIEKLHCNPKLRRWIEGYNRDSDHWEMISEGKHDR